MHTNILQTLPDITRLILELPRLGNPFLSQSSYSTLSAVLSLGGSQEDEDIAMTPPDKAEIHDVVQVILASAPAKGDTTLPPAWVEAVGTAMTAYHRTDAFGCSAEFGKAWKSVWYFITSADAATRKASALSLDLLCGCITESLLKSAHRGKTNKSPVSSIISDISKAIDSLDFARSMGELLMVISSVIESLADLNRDISKELLLPLVKRVGDLRTGKDFEYKEAADDVLGTAMRSFGPHIVLEALPLNLEPTDRYLTLTLAQPLQTAHIIVPDPQERSLEHTCYLCSANHILHHSPILPNTSFL